MGSHHVALHDVMFQLQVHEVLFDLLPYIRRIDHFKCPHAPILCVLRDHVISYFDQISIHKIFDEVVGAFNTECPADEGLPAFWLFSSELIERKPFIPPRPKLKKVTKVACKSNGKSKSKSNGRGGHKSRGNRNRKQRNQRRKRKGAKSSAAKPKSKQQVVATT